jgi:hypothetical protein
VCLEQPDAARALLDLQSMFEGEQSKISHPELLLHLLLEPCDLV